MLTGRDKPPAGLDIYNRRRAANGGDPAWMVRSSCGRGCATKNLDEDAGDGKSQGGSDEKAGEVVRSM
jgi:hypothetical protein